MFSFARTRFLLLLASLSFVTVGTVVVAPIYGAVGNLSFFTSAALSAPSVKPSAREIRAFQIEWQSALLDVRAGRFARAAHTLESLQPRDSLTQIYRASFLAETYLTMGERKQAARVLDEILSPARPALRDPVWVRHLYRLRLQAYEVTAPPAVRRDFLNAALRAPLDDGMRLQVLYLLLALDESALPARERSAALRQLVSLAFANARLDSLYRQESPAYPSSDSVWDNQKLMLDLEEKLGLWQKAIDRAQAVIDRGDGLKPAFISPDIVKSLQLKIALWYYNKGSYSESIKRYNQWRDRYGDTPDVLQQIARAYRNLSQDARAQTVYSRLLDQYPSDPRAAEIIWMRTFDAEALGHTEDAIEGYTRVIEDFPQHARAPEAMFRIGLTYYKRGDYEAAQKYFRDLRLAQKTGKLVGAARYWEGKSLAKRGDGAGARAVWRDLAGAYPFGYYGHQAQRELKERGSWPDSLEWGRRFRDLPDGAVRLWMLTSIPGTREVPEGTGESPYLPLTKLLNLGMDSLALLTLQSQVGAASGNPWVLYTAATRCRDAGFGYEAYRFGVKLSDRLPLEAWPTAPLSVLRLFYPPSYENMVRIEATRAGVAPSLVLALIKQESGFEPRAVSRVGARGLMQMMPATGAIQARKEKIGDFDADSLFVPRVNTRLGIAYLRDILKRYNGNPYYALAHYNAGPNALERWLPRLDGRPAEESVEDIGYAETRDYVKRVMANYWTYQELWN
jgi:soluble lytic murein transglycosylase-like protein/outer membrane protein assembly factor BamD (BamD/ComL family)